MISADESEGNPFPGLRPFHEKEEHFFFGRENQVDAMVDKLSATRFLAVVGTSGSGKSSLVNCGLRPALHRGLMSGAGTSWRMVQFRPGGRPLTALTSALAADGALYTGYHGPIPLEELLDTPLRLSRRGLIDAFRRARLPDGVNLLVVVDQFEELFRYRWLGDSDAAGGDRSQEAVALVNLLLEVKREVDLPIYVVITMRSDFLGNCAEFPGLPEAINEGQYLVPRMTREERREAIKGPVGVGEATITPVLLTRLVNDVGDNPDQLSILQHALNRTWARWQHEERGQGPLDLPHYEAIGTMARALDQHAEKAYQELESEGAKKCCEKIFKALTDKGTDPRGVRRPTEFKTLCALANASPAEVIEVIDVFRKPSRSFLMPPLPEVPRPDTVIDISHESLMRVWERLKEWADEEAQSAHLYRRLAETAALHAADKAGLWRDPDLQLALEWRKKEEPSAVWAGLYRGGFEPAMAFLAKSEALRQKEVEEKEKSQKRQLQQAQALAQEQQRRAEEQTRAARRLRWWVAVAGVAAILALGFALFAFKTTKQAEDAKKDAIAKRIEAELAKKIAEDAQEGLKAANDTAEEAKERALDAAQAARSALTVAKTQKSRAEQEARRNLSHELAGESVNELKPDPGLSLLLALEAVSTTYKTDKSVEKEAEGALQLALQASQKKLFASGHTGAVLAVAYSPDGSRLATAGADGTTRVWDATSGLCLLTLSGHTGTVWSVVFSPNGKILATAGQDRTVRVWDAGSGKELRTLIGHTGAVLDLAISPDGKRLATSSRDGSARIWELSGSSGKPLTFSGHSDAVSAVTFSANGKLLATASDDGTAKVWDAAAPGTAPVSFSHEADSARLEKRGAIYAVAFSPDGERLATAGLDKIVRLWDLRAPTTSPRTLHGHTDTVRVVAFSSDGKHLVSAGDDNTAKVWDVAAAGERSTTLSGHTKPVYGVAFNSDGQRVATASGDGTARLWDVSFGQELLELSNLSVKETVLALSTDGKVVAAYGSDGSLKLWDGVSGLELLTLLPNTNSGSIRSAAFGPGGRYVCAIGSDKTAHVWDTESGKEVRHFSVDAISSVLALSPDGGLLATISGGVLKVWDSRTGKSSPLLVNVTANSPSVAFSPDGGRLAATTAERMVKLWDVHSWIELTKLLHVDGVDALAFSPDSKRVATSSRDNTLRFWNVQSGEELRNFQIQVSGVYQMAFSPNGLKLGTVSRDGHLGVWKVGTAEEELALPGAQLGLRLAFHPDGDLITGTRDMTVSEYPLTVEELLAISRRHVARPWTDDQCRLYLHNEHCPSEAEALSYVVEGNDFSRAGDASAAAASFGRARDVDPTLQLDAKEEIRELEAEALLARGRSLAWAGDWEHALANFKQALALDPELHFNPAEAARHLAAPAFVDKGRNLARSGDRKGAIASFRQAKELDPSLNLVPEDEAGAWMAKSQFTKGITLANSGDVDGATKAFQEARQSDPAGNANADRASQGASSLSDAGDSLVNSGDVEGAIKAFREALTLEPKAGMDARGEAAASLVKKGKSEAAAGNVDSAVKTYKKALELNPDLKLDDPRKEAATSLVKRGKSEAAAENVDGAIATFQKAKELDPSLKLDPGAEANRPRAEGLYLKARQLVREDKFAESMAAYSQAVSVYSKYYKDLDPNGRIRANAWNDLCWEGGIRGHAAEVMFACEEAVTLQPNNADIYDSRGLARALTNNFGGAAADFQFFIDHQHGHDDLKPQRKQWIEALHNGQNPFTPDELKTLANQ